MSLDELKKIIVTGTEDEWIMESRYANIQYKLASAGFESVRHAMKYALESMTELVRLKRIVEFTIEDHKRMSYAERKERALDQVDLWLEAMLEAINDSIELADKRSR